MQAISIIRSRIPLDDDSFVELVIWKLPEPLAGSAHDFKYRLALVSGGVCMMRYDNEAGKGDHKHCGEHETDYVFSDLEQLRSDFWADVEAWRKR
jgi:pyridoxal biosynthesis lyase PdxS